MKEKNQILIEGYTIDELLNLPDSEINNYIFLNKPIVFKIGTAEILGEFRRTKENLIVQLAQIDGGGEGILPALTSLIEKYSKINNFNTVEWIVHATNCAKPNLKLKRILERKGFVVTVLLDSGEAYYLKQEVK